MDAISFVLGIKSSHLRSTHLRDLVYRGRVLNSATINGDGSATADGANGQANGGGHSDGETQSQSQSQSQRSDPKTAWVMAVYEDDAGDEQSWKRTITNQGASEYRINSRVVTAQQYNEALEAENILIRARNFLVFQGDVEAVASQSPKDLTRLIEQISGSLEYKAEYERLKEASEEAAEQQTYMLNRRRGINSEIKQYQEQKREAENYARKASERDDAVVTHILWKLFHFQRTMDESSAEIQKHQDELKEYRRGVQKYEKQLDDAKKEHARAGRDVARVERDIKSKEREIEDKENALVPIDEKIDISKKKITTYKKRQAEISKERDSQASSEKQLAKDLKTVEKAQAQWETQWQRTVDNQGRQLAEADIQEYNRLREEVSKQSSGDQTKLDNMQRQYKAEEETVNSLKSRVDGLEWQVQSQQADIEGINERKDILQDLIRETSKDIDEKKKAYNTLTSERLRVAQKRTELEEKLQEVLKKLVEADDGRKQSEKETRMKEMIYTLKRIFPGVKGRVSDLCKPKQKKYGDAVSTVLGRHFDAVVVDNEKTAKDCIEHLRDQRAGQATFIPLETIQVKALNSNLKGMHRGMRPAIDTIDFDSSVSRAISYACGNSIVCDDLAIAKYLCYEKGVDAKAVTLDGTVIHKGGLMTGGRGPGDRNQRRWEDADVEAHNKVKDNLLAQLSALPKGHRRGAEEETLQGELSGLEHRLTTAREELVSFDRNLASKTKELDFTKRQLQEARPRYEEKLGELEQLGDNIDSYKDAVSGVEDQVFATFCQRLGYDNIRQYEAQQGSLQDEHNQKRLEFANQKNKLENQLSFERGRLQQTEARLNAIENQEHRDQTLIDQLEQDKDSIQSEIDVLNAEREQLEEQLEIHKARQVEKAEKLNRQKQEVQKRTKTVEGTLKIVAGLEADVQRNASARYAQLRRCKLEDINIPLTETSASLDALPIDDLMQRDPDAMEVDDDPMASNIDVPGVQDYGIEVDFDGLDDELKENDDDKLDSELQATISSLSTELEKMAPNMRAIDRLEGVEAKLKTTDKDFENARRAAKRAKDDFEDIMHQRSELFNKAFTHIHDQIGPIYKDLTRSTATPMGGQA